MRTKEQIIESMRLSMESYGIKTKHGGRLNDVEVLEAVELICDNFTALTSELSKFNDSVVVIFGSSGNRMEDIGLFIDFGELKENQN